MRRFSSALLVTLSLLPSARAGIFNQGIGSAMIYGPYTGGHAYSYNTAYSYGFAFSPADTWRRDPFAYPAGISPYRPFGRPIFHRVFPKSEGPYVSVPGPDGLPVLVKPDAGAIGTDDQPVTGVPVPQKDPLTPQAAVPGLRPVPGSAPAAPVANVSNTEGTARIRVVAPAAAEVWVEKESLPANGATERIFQTRALPEGKMQVYAVRARWIEGGRPVEQYRVVGVRAGETARLTFTAQP